MIYDSLPYRDGRRGFSFVSKNFSTFLYHRYISSLAPHSAR